MLQWCACALLLVLSGCYAQYPSTWRPLDAVEQDCSSISGVYHAKGSGSRYGTPDLAPRVLQDEKIRLVGAERVELRVEDGVLAVQVFSANESLHARQFLMEAGEYSCEDGNVRMSRVLTDGLGARRIRTVLSKTADGALVVEDAGEGLGFFVVPIAGSEFLRFEAYTSEPPKAI